jgi:hypothetical protein
MIFRLVIASMLFGIVGLVGLLGVDLNDSVLEGVQEQGFQSVNGELRTRIETDLRIGLELPDDERAQTMVEDAATRTPLLESIEVDSNDGRVLFASDRALRGQEVPEAWRAAARTDPSGWRVARQDEHSLGSPLHDTLGETVGYLVSTHREGRDEGIGWSVLIRVLGIGAVTAGLALLALELSGRRSRSRHRGDWSRLQSVGASAGDEALGEVTRVLAEARIELARIEREAHHIAGIEP